jgi:purine-nucleoside phosphorylase
MIANRAWVKRNLGFDPISTPAPPSTYAVAEAAKPKRTPEDLQREIIDFDSEGPEGAAFFAFTTATGLSRFTAIPWPKGLAPKTDTTAAKGKAGALPQADVLIVTWTLDEGHALSRVLTPGKDSRDDFAPYTHNYAAIAAKMSKGAPAVKSKRLGAYWTATIGKKKIVVFKSESHLSQDTDKHAPPAGQPLPNDLVWTQLINEVQPKLVITTGTAGGIGKTCEVGDVIVSQYVQFDSQKWLTREPFAQEPFSDSKPNTKLFSQAKKLFKANSDQLPKDNTRPPIIALASGQPSGVLTTDFFGFDTSNNFFKLQGKGSVCEMGDAVLGLVASQMGDKAPRWVAVRNVSDPQIKAEGTLKDQGDVATQIYKGFGRWSSICSAIVCWALVAAEN